ncbi:MAG: ketoacyl-ACP synthase III [Bacteroidota bacterium]
MKIASYLPQTTFTNADFEREFPDWNASKIEEKVGIRQRHIAAKDETALDMAFQAAEKVLAGEDRATVDFILLCTQSPDYFLPTSACILQDRLGLRTQAGALDYNLGCSGFIYGLALSKGLLAGGIATRVLLVMSETYSKHMHPGDRANRSIFGDGAAAVLLDPDDLPRIGTFELGTDGSGKNNLIVEAGAMRKSCIPGAAEIPSEDGTFHSPNYLYMNGPEIFNFTIDSVPGLVGSVLRKNNLTLDEIDYVIFHQANKYMLEYLRKKIRIPAEKYYNNMLMTGNTVSATIPIALRDCLDTGRIAAGSKLLLVGFGVGYSWGAVVLTWQ